jgi:hypothetical protein
VIVLADGELIAQGSPAEVRAERACAASTWRGSRSMLELKGLNSGYGRAQVLFDFELDWRRARSSRCSAATGPARHRAEDAMGLLPCLPENVFQ